MGALMGVGYRSDLVVSELSAPVSVGDGQSFTATVKVCNQGTTSTSNYSWPRVSLYLSSDASFSMPEQSMPYPGSGEPMPIGTVDLDQTLSPSQCVTKSVNAYASLPMGSQGNTSAYYLVAAVDTNRVEQELREDNNVHVGGLTGVGYRSDLVVSEVRGPASASDGQSFTASVKVCNQGTTSTGGYYYYSMPRVEVFLSMDSELTMPDPSMSYSEMPRDQVSIGSVELEQSLAPGQCVTKDVSAHAWVPPESMVMDGAYYLAAAVDTAWTEQELREDNNVRVGALMGVGYRSDLVVSEVSGPASAGNGQSFTASVKVCNQGTATTGGYSYSMPRVELLLSMDTELTFQDPSSSYPSVARDQTSIGYVTWSSPCRRGSA
jgi:large repetitive protein